eukprot:1160568-Pelagomonas_calceolata.AAC.6
MARKKAVSTSMSSSRVVDVSRVATMSCRDAGTAVESLCREKGDGRQQCMCDTMSGRCQRGVDRANQRRITQEGYVGQAFLWKVRERKRGICLSSVLLGMLGAHIHGDVVARKKKLRHPKGRAQ